MNALNIWHQNSTNRKQKSINGKQRLYFQVEQVQNIFLFLKLNYNFLGLYDEENVSSFSDDDVASI